MGNGTLSRSSRIEGGDTLTDEVIAQAGLVNLTEWLEYTGPLSFLSKCLVMNAPDGAQMAAYGSFVPVAGRLLCLMTPSRAVVMR
jgi:hypothetical protein